MFVPQRALVVRDGVAELGLVLAVEHERNAELGGDLGRELLLPQYKRLERVEQVLGRQAGQQAVGQAVGGAQVVVEPGVNPRLEVLPPPGGVDVRRPGHGQRVHAVFVFQQVGGVKAVLAAGAGHQAVVAAVGFAVTVAQFAQLLLALRPVDVAVGFLAAGVAGVAHAVRLDDHGLFLGKGRVLKLIAGVGLLVGHDAVFAKGHGLRQAVIRRAPFGRQGGVVLGVVDRLVTRQFQHGKLLFLAKQTRAGTRARQGSPLPGLRASLPCVLVLWFSIRPRPHSGG